MEVTATKITGVQRGSSFYVDENRHLYRPLRKKSETTMYINCYFNRPLGKELIRQAVSLSFPLHSLPDPSTACTEYATYAIQQPSRTSLVFVLILP